MSAHTPGPWSVFVDNDGNSDRFPGIESGEISIVVFGDSDDDFQGVRGRTPEESLANAHLIAAAPALFEALRVALEVVGDAARDCYCRASSLDPPGADSCGCRICTAGNNLGSLAPTIEAALAAAKGGA